MQRRRQQPFFSTTFRAIALSQENVHVKNHPSQLNINAHLQ
jgi:hypothetical protein